MNYLEYVGDILIFSLVGYSLYIYAEAVNHTSEIIVPNTLTDWILYLLTITHTGLTVFIAGLYKSKNGVNINILLFISILSTTQFVVSKFIIYQNLIMNYVILAIFGVCLYQILKKK